MTALPVNNVKCISGNVDNTYFALKKDDTIWYWNRNDDGSVSEACRLYSESGEIGSGTVIISEEYGKPGTEYYRLGQSQLEEKGWAEIENNNKSGRNQQSAENGEFTASEGRLIINKTSDRSIANTTGEDLIYAVEKTFEYVEDDWQGDAHVTMRTKNFKGKYAVEITGCFKQTDSQVYYDIIGRDSSGNKAVVGRYRSDSGYYGYFSVYNNKLNGANTNRYHLWQDCRITREISTYLDTPEATFKTLLNGSGIACEQLSKGRIPKASFL